MSTMKRRFLKIIKFPFYFALFAIYPVLALLAFNISELRYQDAIRAVVVSLLAALLLFFLFWRLFHSKQRAALTVTILLLLFYGYGHLYNLIAKQWDIPHLTVWMLGLWLILAGAAVGWLARRRTRVRKAAPVLNIVLLGLVITSMVQAALWSPSYSSSVADDYAPVETLSIPDGQTPPDIYYIILDSYGRSDLIKRAFQIDNSGFIKDLEAMGFYVSKCSQSNYNRTDISLASSLNMDYLQNLDSEFHGDNEDRRTLWESISRSAVRADLESAGYKTVAFATGFAWSEVRDADFFLSPSSPFSQMTGFETLLMRTTPLRHLEDTTQINLDEIDGQRYRQRTDYIFNKISDVAHLPGPKFVFIHLIPPHPPFVYAADGSQTDPATFLNDENLYTYQAYGRGYTGEIAFISGQVETAVQTILAESSQPPVIILQGDHAPWLQNGDDRFMILNAYYLPGHNDLLYPTISPVNTFRLVLDTYLGADYPLLDDVSYASPVPHVYNFSEASNPCSDR
jgi:hypothetical protein